MDKFRTWYLEYQNEITWFVVGLLFTNILQHSASGQWTWVLFDLIIAGININFWRLNRDR